MASSIADEARRCPPFRAAPSGSPAAPCCPRSPTSSSPSSPSPSSGCGSPSASSLFSPPCPRRWRRRRAEPRSGGGEAEDLLGLVEALHRVEPQRDDGLTRGQRKLPRQQQRPVEALRQAFEAEGEVDGGADRGEVEAVGGADIAEDDLAQMEADADADGDATRGEARPAQRLDAAERLVRRGERRPRRRRVARPVDGEA